MAVVGGGPAGLAAALLAARAGRSVILIEASDRLGGMAASVDVSGQRVDLGSHRLHPSASGPTRALIEELLGGDLQVRHRLGRLRLGDRWVGFPLRAGDLMRSVPPRQALAIARDLVTGPLRKESEWDTYADVVRARLGPTVLDTFHGPYARKLWGVPPEQLAGHLARRRIALSSAGDVIRKLARTARPEGRTFLYPRLGYGQIVDRLADACVRAGVEIVTGQRPTCLAPPSVARSQATASVPSSTVVHLTLRSNVVVDVSRVFWTAAPNDLLGCLPEERGDHDRKLAAPAVEYRGVVLVYLTLDQPQYTQFDAHYVPAPAVPFVRLSEPKNYRDGPDPVDRTVLCAEVPATLGDDVWQSDDRILGSRVLDGIGRLGLPSPRVISVDSIRLPHVYPRYDNAGAERLDQQVQRAGAVPGVTLLGRQGLGVIDNLHHVIDMARLAVGCLRPDGAWDEAEWTRAVRRFATHVVED